MTTYTRRQAPPTYDNAWVDVETANIAAAVNGTPATNPTVVELAADVSNSANATDKPTGLKAAVVAGSTYRFRWTVFVNSNGNTGGCAMKITHPAYTSAVTHYRGTSTATNAYIEDMLSVTTSPIATSVFVSYAGVGIVVIEHRLTPSANGTVELTMNPTTNAQNYTIRAGSTLEVFSA